MAGHSDNVPMSRLVTHHAAVGKVPIAMLGQAQMDFVKVGKENLEEESPYHWSTDPEPSRWACWELVAEAIKILCNGCQMLNRLLRSPTNSTVQLSCLGVLSMIRIGKNWSKKKKRYLPSVHLG